jgi:hypothetical protein
LWQIVKSSTLNGLVLASAGVFFALLGFIVLATLAEDIGSCWQLLLAVSGCWNPPEVSVSAFYAAISGSALFTVGVWESGIGREKTTVEGAALVLFTGSAILALGFYVASLPNVSYIAGEIGYLCGLLGGSMLIGALAKFESAVRILPQYQPR